MGALAWPAWSRCPPALPCCHASITECAGLGCCLKLLIDKRARLPCPSCIAGWQAGRALLRREHATGLYSLTPWLLARCAYWCLYVTLRSLFFTLPVYWLAGLQASAAKYFAFAAVFWLVAFTGCECAKHACMCACSAAGVCSAVEAFCQQAVGRGGCQ